MIEKLLRVMLPLEKATWQEQMDSDLAKAMEFLAQMHAVTVSQGRYVAMLHQGLADSLVCFWEVQRQERIQAAFVARLVAARKTGNVLLFYYIFTGVI